jgi:hypothetical protein
MVTLDGAEKRGRQGTGRPERAIWPNWPCLANGTTGVNGIWSYDCAQKKCTTLTTELPPHVGRVAFDPEHDVFVASPGPASEARGFTWVFSL